jgi:alpha-L-fucosidase
MRQTLLLILILISGGTMRLFSQSNDQKSKLIGNEKRIQEWKDARFGMMITWGPVSLKGTEISWSRGDEIPVDVYDNLYKQFNPLNFNAEEWVSVARAAGMKYIVLITKHHDGFCLWNTRQTDYNIMNSPFHRDVVKELSEACRKQGIEFGTYYSTTDWHHPDFPLTSPGGNVKREKSNLEAYTTYLKRQVGELLLNYGPLFTLWFDVPQEFDAVRGQSVIDYAHQIQPNIVIDDRSGAKGDFDTPEQRVGGFQNNRPWETAMTIADQWAWKPNDEVKSLEQCLQSLIRTAGGDGNFMFGVGPKPDGTIEPLQIARLKEMGQWLQKYGSAIYETRGGPFKPADWGVSTRKGNFVYLHILKWQGNAPKITLPDLGIEIKNCRLVQGGNINLTKPGKDYTLEFSAKDLQPINTIVELEFAGNIMNVAPVEINSNSLSYLKLVNASSNLKGHWSNHLWVELAAVTNGDMSASFWEPEPKDAHPWVEVDLGKLEKIREAILYERGNSVQAFELQALVGEKWKTLAKGNKIGSKLELKLPKTTAQKVRLILKEFSKVPGIYEIVLL